VRFWMRDVLVVGLRLSPQILNNTSDFSDDRISSAVAGEIEKNLPDSKRLQITKDELWPVDALKVGAPQNGPTDLVKRGVVRFGQNAVAFYHLGHSKDSQLGSSTCDQRTVELTSAINRKVISANQSQVATVVSPWVVQSLPQVSIVGASPDWILG